MDPIIVIEQVTVLAILMAVGYLGGKTGILKENENSAMTILLTHIAMPALILSAFSLGYSKETLNGIIIVFILSLFAHGLGALIGKIAYRKYPRGKNVVLRFGNTFTNSGFMGVPFVYALFGEKALLYGSVFMIPFHILLWTYGEGLLKTEKEKMTINKFAKNPAIIAILVGIAIFVLNIKLPRIIDQPINMLSSLTSPLAMLILGEKISKLSLKEILVDKDIYYACLIKLIISPVITLLILNFIDIEPLIKNIVVIMQSLPFAVLTVVLSQKHDADVELASKVTVVSHVLSVITIPLIALLL